MPDGDPPRPRPLTPRTPRSLRSPSPERQVAFRVGISAESRAAALLIAKGFRILARRFRSPVGEIDIVRAGVISSYSSRSRPATSSTMPPGR